MKLNEEIIDKICKHALKEYPYECCGIITGIDKRQTIHYCINIQNRLHNEDPESYPRDARTAYNIERSKLNSIISKAHANGDKIIAFYHSHPEHEAFFSQEDYAAQTVFGEPEFPDALQVVVSVFDKKVADIKGYKWDRESNRFLQISNLSTV